MRARGGQLFDMQRHNHIIEMKKSKQYFFCKIISLQKKKKEVFCNFCYYIKVYKVFFVMRLAMLLYENIYRTPPPIPRHFRLGNCLTELPREIVSVDLIGYLVSLIIFNSKMVCKTFPLSCLEPYFCPQIFTTICPSKEFSVKSL